MGSFVSLVVTVCTVWLFYAGVRTKPWRSVLKAALLTFLSCVALLVAAALGLLVIQTGSLGMARAWASFGESYLWGMLLMPVGVFCVSLAAFAFRDAQSAGNSP